MLCEQGERFVYCNLFSISDAVDVFLTRRTHGRQTRKRDNAYSCIECIQHDHHLNPYPHHGQSRLSILG